MHRTTLAELVDVGDDDHRQGRQRRIGLDLREGLVAVELGHDQIEQDDVDGRRPGVPQARQGETTVLGLQGLVTERGQEPGEHQPVDPAVVDHQHPGGSGEHDLGCCEGGHEGDDVQPERRRSAKAASTRANSASAAVSAASAPSSDPERAPSSSSRASPASAWAPSVALLDLSVWAGRTSASAEPAAMAARAAASCSGASDQVRRGELVEEGRVGADRFEKLDEGRLVEAPRPRSRRSRALLDKIGRPFADARRRPGSGPPRARPCGSAC